MLPFIHNHRKLSAIAAIVVLMLTMLFNIYLVATPYSGQDSNKPLLSEDEINRRLPGFSAADGADPLSANSLPLLNYPLIIGSLLVIILGAVAILAVAKLVDQKKLQQDTILKKQLADLALAFELYGRENGHYPISSTYRPEHYTGVHMGQEWLAYGLPKDEEMRRYAPSWPIVDVSRLPGLVYYPKQNGQSFALYANIETLSKSDAVDYNIEDNIPKAWGEFNFRIVSRGLSPESPTMANEIRSVVPPVIPDQASQAEAASQEGDAR